MFKVRSSRVAVCDRSDDICVPNSERAEGVKMLKWIKVRQNASTTPTSPGSQEIRRSQDETRVKTGDKVKEEGEDSGMEKEDSVCNVELSDLKKVRFYRSVHKFRESELLRILLLTARVLMNLIIMNNR